MLKLVIRTTLFAAAALALAACQDGGGPGSARARAPIPQKTVALMQEKGMSQAAPILIRSYKKEAELEVWKRDSKGEYALLKTYPICRWSGQLGPKIREGDRQAPEGFYTITPTQMNPNSSFYLSFDTGFPNAYDRAYGRTGRYLMVHGACSSAGCFSMTDEQIAEIYAIGREAFAGGQRSFQFQSYPFRMTPQNLARYRNDPNIAFWRNLKEGSDYFEVTKQIPAVGVCNKRYVFGSQSASCGATEQPAIAQALAQKRANDDHKIAELVSTGAKAVRLVYQDGGQHPSFRGEGGSVLSFSRPTRFAGNISRPDALASAPQEIEMPDSAPASSAIAMTPRPATTPAAADPVATGSVTAVAATAPAAQPLNAAAEAPSAGVFSKALSLGGILSGDKPAQAADPVKAAEAPSPSGG
ncbi:L,D-transpeptidase family protein [Camelimonas sp. ID_303_24]